MTLIDSAAGMIICYTPTSVDCTVLYTFVVEGQCSTSGTLVVSILGVRTVYSIDTHGVTALGFYFAALISFGVVTFRFTNAYSGRLCTYYARRDTAGGRW